MLHHQGMKLFEKHEVWTSWRRCGLAGGSVAGGRLLGFKSLHHTQSPCPVSLYLSLLPVYQDIKLSVTAPVTSLSYFHPDGDGLTFYSYKQAPD